MAPAPAGDDLVAACVVAARHAAERLEQLADARECALDCAARGAADAAGAAREIGVLASAAAGALLALHREAAWLVESPPEGVEAPGLDGAAWAPLVAGCVEGPDDDRELAEGLAAWAAEQGVTLAPGRLCLTSTEVA